MNTQMNAVHKIMQILDDNAQQVPEGFYLEVCNQLKNLHGAVNNTRTTEILLGPEFPTSALDEAERMLNRRVEQLKRDQEELNGRVLDYNKKAIEYKEKCKKYKEAVAQLKKRDTQLKAREARLDEIEDNMTLAELKRTLGIH
jgi:DNA repair exonuclease SbcCD ATPase subunit